MKKTNEENFKLKQLDALSSISYKVSHDVVGCLINISQITELIEGETQNSLNKATLEYLSMIRSIGTKLIGIVESYFLLISEKFTTEKSTSFSLSQLIKDLKKDLNLEDSFELSYEGLDKINTNKMAIKTVLESLVIFMIDHSEQSQNIKITSLIQADKHVKISLNKSMDRKSSDSEMAQKHKLNNLSLTIASAIARLFDSSIEISKNKVSKKEEISFIWPQHVAKELS